jgi:hypothetical protein
VSLINPVYLGYFFTFIVLSPRKSKKGKGKAVSAVTGLEWPRGFQEVKVPRFHDNGTGW